MSKHLSLLVVLVVMVVVVAMVCDAQSSSNNRRVGRQRERTRSRDNANNTNRPPRRPRPSRPPRRNRPGTSGSGGGGRGRGGNRRRRPPHASCQEIYLPMCKGLVPYTHTKLPNRYNHTTQLEVYRVLEHKWSQMDQSCSRNMRLMLCSLYLPKCHGPRPGLGPCKRTCMQARRKCSRTLTEMMGITWGEAYLCRNLTNRRCLRPVRERPCPHRYPTCIENNVFPICANLSFTWGTTPNMFGQCDVQEINTEVQYYDELRATNCHPSLNFMLCGVYSPFCIRNEVPFTFPCRELCDEIRTSCEPHYRRLYHDLPWPNKLQCHRYPSTETEGYSCVMPNEGSTFMGGR